MTAPPVGKKGRLLRQGSSFLTHTGPGRPSAFDAVPLPLPPPSTHLLYHKLRRLSRLYACCQAFAQHVLSPPFKALAGIASRITTTIYGGSPASAGRGVDEVFYSRSRPGGPAQAGRAGHPVSTAGAGAGGN